MHENAVTEFKVEYVPEIRKTIVAFANTNGGTLYIGMNDAGVPVGVKDPDETILKVTNMLRDSIKPDITMFTTCDIEHVDGNALVVVRTQRGTACPYYLAGKGIRPEGVYIRQGASSVPAADSAILQMIKETDGENYEEVRSLNQDLTFQATEKAFREESIAFGPAQMKTLGFINEEGLFTNLALLLSDQNVHAIKVAVFQGTEKTVFKDRFELTGSLLKQLDEVSSLINRYNRTQSQFEGLKRVDEQDYPADAIRETLLNTIVHRDFSFSGPALISIFDDRMEFVTLGGLVKGINQGDLELGISILRNKRLANVFYRLKLIEAYGTGIPKIRESYRGHSLQVMIETSDHAFKITLPNTNHEIAESSSITLDANEEKVLSLFKQQGIVYRKDAESTLSVSTTMAGRVLKSLVEKGKIEQVGKGRSTRYQKKQ